MKTKVRMLMASIAVTTMCALSSRGDCIKFWTHEKYPNIVDKRMIRPGASAAVAATCQFDVRARFEGCDKDEHTPSGAFMYAIKYENGDWGEETEKTFGCNSGFITVTWNDANKTKGNFINYAFEYIEYKESVPWQNKQVKYTAVFSTEKFKPGLKRSEEDLKMELQFADGEAGGAELQVWALITGAAPNVRVGSKAAFPYNTGGYHAIVKYYAGEGQWNPVQNGQLPNNNRIE